MDLVSDSSMNLASDSSMNLASDSAMDLDSLINDPNVSPPYYQVSGYLLLIVVQGSST